VIHQPGTIGVPVVEAAPGLLKYDEMFLSAERAAIVVGEIAHFRWRIEQRRRNEECRLLARRYIERFAEKILGEPWKCQDSGVTSPVQ
jgi:hypothetical protein